MIHKQQLAKFKIKANSNRRFKYKIQKHRKTLRGWTWLHSATTLNNWDRDGLTVESRGASGERNLISFFNTYKIEMIDNSSISGIVWAVVDSSWYLVHNERIREIAASSNIECVYERRGSIATNGRAAYRVMVKKKREPLSAKFEIVDIFGSISDENISEKRKKAFMLVSWNGHSPTYEIRKWNNDTESLGKGISLSEEELRKLKVLIDEEIQYLDSENDNE